MLVLSRKTNQEILINGNIKVSVLKIKGNVVRIGIEAPAEVSIKRGELVPEVIELPIELPVEQTAGADADQGTASFTLEIDSQTPAVAEEAGGYQLLPMPHDGLAADDSAASDYDMRGQFPETLQRGLSCNAIVSS